MFLKTLACRTAAISALLVASALICESCSSSPGQALEAAQQTASPQAVESLALPAPAELAGLVDSPRRAAYVETDLIRQGLDYEGLLPSRNVSITGKSVEFSPSWSTSSGMDLANLAFCMYSFGVNGYDREPELRYGWTDPPADISTAWLGLTNWDKNSWDWFRCNAAGRLTVASFAPYISGSDSFVATLVLANDEVSSLRYIRLGHGVVEAQLIISQAAGLAPMNAYLNATGSATALGTIERYEWDFDGDGVFETDTGTDATATHTYTATGSHSPAMRATSSYGESGVDTAALRAVEPWMHSWGGPGQDRLNAVVFDGDDGIYAAGLTGSFGAGGDVLLLKYSLAGELLWARAWGGVDGESASSLAVGGDGNLLLAGYTSSFGAGNADFLLQKWDADGNLLWTRTWGGSNLDWCSAMAMDGGDIYLVGYSHSFGAGGQDVLLVKYDADGNVIWARTWGGVYEDVANDIAVKRTFLGSATNLYVTGFTANFGGGDYDVLYLAYDDDGQLVAQRTWGDAERQYGNAVALKGGLLTESIYIAGENWDGNNAPRRALLLEVSDSNPLRKTWYAEVDHNPEAIMLAATGGFLICGNYDGSTGGELFKLSETGALESAEIISHPAVFHSLEDLAYVHSNGMLVAGHSGAALETSWAANAGTLGDSAISWQNAVAANMSATGSIGSPAGTVTEITDAIEDTGGGSLDALLALRLQP